MKSKLSLSLILALALSQTAVANENSEEESKESETTVSTMSLLEKMFTVKVYECATYPLCDDHAEDESPEQPVTKEEAYHQTKSKKKSPPKKK